MKWWKKSACTPRKKHSRIGWPIQRRLRARNKSGESGANYSLRVRSKFLSYGFQRRIKLHEGVFDRGVVIVALPALRFGQRLRARGVTAKTEVRPLVREMRFVLYFHRQPVEVGLKGSGLVDGTFGFGRAFLEDEYSFVRPFPAG